MNRLLKRRWLFFTLLPVILLTALWIWLIQSPSASSWVNRDNFQMIHAGMTKAQVDAILGNDYSDGHPSPGVVLRVYGDVHRSVIPKDAIWVQFEHNLMVEKQYVEGGPRRLWDRLVYELNEAFGPSPAPAAPPPFRVPVPAAPDAGAAGEASHPTKPDVLPLDQ